MDINVLIIGFFYYPLVGGVETMMGYHIRGLNARGYHCTVITSLSVDNLPEVEQQDRVTIYRTKLLNKSVDDLNTSEELRKWLENRIIDIKPDIIHCHNFSFIHAPNRSKAIFEIANNQRIPIIEHCHNAQQRSREITRPIVNLPWTKIIAVSEYSKQALIEQGASEDRVEVIYNCVDPEMYNPLTKPLDLYSSGIFNEKVKLLFPARIFTIDGKKNPSKPIEPIMLSLKCLKEQGIDNFILIIINNVTANPSVAGENLKLIRSLFQEYGLENNYYVTGSVEQSEMPRLYAGADAILAIFPVESFGLVFVESMLMQKPLIAPNTGAALEVVKEGTSGYLVNLHTNELGDIIRDIINHRIDTKKIGISARRYAMDRFSPELFGQKIDDLYKKIMLGEK